MNVMNKNDTKETLIEFITQDIIAKIVSEKNLDVKQAMNEFYSSAILKKLQDYETGLYLEGTDYIYDLFKEQNIK